MASRPETFCHCYFSAGVRCKAAPPRPSAAAHPVLNMPLPFLRLGAAAAVFAATIAFTACKKDEPAATPAPADTTDATLYTAARVATGFTWFENADSVRAKSSGSGHSQAFLRTRYNTLAAAQLDAATGRVRAGAVFATGSLIVKELHPTRTGGLNEYAVMRKDPTNAHAAANGWVWAMLKADGSVSVSATQKGAGCVGCHGQAGHVDATLMNKFFR